MDDYSIGIDIGGTKIAAGIVDKNGSVFYKQIHPTPKQTKKTILELISNIVLSYMRLAEEEGIKLAGVGVGSAGQVDYRNGKILSGTKNIKDWNDVEIKSYLLHHTDLPVFLDNDANTFAIAEYYLGSRKQTGNIVCLTLGTGIGGGVISEGRVVRGEWGGAAELGHTTVNMNGPKCNCGSRGCLETYASGSGIANQMKEKLQFSVEENNEEIYFYKENPDELTSKDVFKLYSDGVPLAKEVINLSITALSYGIVNLIHTFNPSIVILGGGLVEGRDWFAAKIKTNINNIGLSTLVKPVDISISKLGNDAGLIGAAYQVWSE